MTVIGEAFVAVKADTKGFAADAEGGILGGITGIAKKAAGILGGAFAFKKGFDFLSDSVDAARESNKVAAQTEAVIKSTGGAAQVSAKQFGDLATAISNKTGVDDEAIQSAENLLATFTNVKNGVGKGNDVFNQATATLVDMGAALGTDASGSAIQLGKALNDPIKGIAALSRVGVTFTDQQKEQIKTMQESGDMAGAQKVILAELSKEFGGSAAAQATASDRLKVTLGNLQEELGAKLIPLLDRAATFIADNLPAALEMGGRAFDRVRDAVTRVWTAIQPTVRTITLGVQALVAAFKDPDVTSDGFVGVMERIGSKAREIFDAVLPVVRKVFDFMQDHAKPILIGLGVAFALITAPVTTVVAALIYAYARFQAVRDVVATVITGIQALVGFIQTTVVPALTTAFGWISEQVASLVGFFQSRSAAIEEAFGHVVVAVQAVMTFIGNVIQAGVDVIQWIWQRFGDNILAILGALWEEVKVIVETAVRIVRDVIDLVLSLINGDWGKAWDALKDILWAAWDFITATVGNALRIVWELVKGGLQLVAGVFDIAWEGIKKAAGAAFDGLKTLAGNAIDGVVDFFKKLPGRILDTVVAINKAGLDLGTGLIKGILSAIGSAASGAADFARDFGRAIIGFVNDHVIDRVNRALEIKFKMPDLLGGGTVSLNPPDIPHLAQGGIFDRPTLGVFGEDGREVVLPITKPARALDLLAQSGFLKNLPNRSGATFAPGAVQLQLVFEANPTPEEAFAAGAAAANALSRALAGRRLAVTARAG